MPDPASGAASADRQLWRRARAGGHRHQDVVEGLAVDDGSVRDAADLSEPARSIAPLRSLVEGENGERDFFEFKLSERVVEHEPRDFASVTLAKPCGIEEANRVTGAPSVERVKPSCAEESPFCLHNPFDPVIATHVGDPRFRHAAGHGARHRVRRAEHAFNLCVTSKRLALCYVGRHGLPEQNVLAYKLRTERHRGILPYRGVPIGSYALPVVPLEVRLEHSVDRICDQGDDGSEHRRFTDRSLNAVPRLMLGLLAHKLDSEPLNRVAGSLR